MGQEEELTELRFGQEASSAESQSVWPKARGSLSAEMLKTEKNKFWFLLYILYILYPSSFLVPV